MLLRTPIQLVAVGKHEFLCVLLTAEAILWRCWWTAYQSSRQITGSLNPQYIPTDRTANKIIYMTFLLCFCLALAVKSSAKSLSQFAKRVALQASILGSSMVQSCLTTGLQLDRSVGQFSSSFLCLLLNSPWNKISLFAPLKHSKCLTKIVHFKTHLILPVFPKHVSFCWTRSSDEPSGVNARNKNVNSDISHTLFLFLEQ